VATPVLAAAGDAPVLAHTLALAEKAILLENIIQSAIKASKSQSIQLVNRVCNFLTWPASGAHVQVEDAQGWTDGDGGREGEEAVLPAVARRLVLPD
jgi:patatin-like phospholipase/acyl hydrolase